MTLPEPFILQMKNMLGSEHSDFEAALYKNPPVSVRLNPYKQENDLNLGKPVPWCSDGFYLEKRPVFTTDPFFHAGHYYVQEASSMFIDFILKSLHLKTNSRILDLCSAPGGKASILLSHLANNGFLHCHEFDSHRVGIVRQNLERWGFPNAIITYGSLDHLNKLDLRYDLILIDAPCSGEGMFRKEEDAWKQWNLKKVNHCSHLQKNIMSIADNLCADNGYIVYSTCTWNVQENENILEKYISTGKYSSIKIENNFEITEFHNQSYTYRLFPHKTEGEGFTVSVIQKQDSCIHSNSANKKEVVHKPHTFISLEYWLKDPVNYFTIPFKNAFYVMNEDCYSAFYEISQKVSTTHLGIPIGNMKGSDFYPAHGLSQSICISKSIPHFSMDINQSLEYLKASTPSAQFTTESKWLLATYKTAKLGWLKSGGSGIKNYFPKNQRIISF